MHRRMTRNINANLLLNIGLMGEDCSELPESIQKEGLA